jgi:hypothetical protein
MHAAAGPGRHLRPAHWPALGSSGGVQDPHVGRESVRDHGAHRGPEAAQPRPQPVGRGDVGRRMQFVVVHQVGPTGQGSSIVSACEGVLKPGICRGRPLSSAAIRSRSAWLYWRRSTVLGRYWRTSPLAFSLLARLPVSLPFHSRPALRPGSDTTVIGEPASLSSPTRPDDRIRSAGRRARPGPAPGRTAPWPPAPRSPSGPWLALERGQDRVAQATSKADLIASTTEGHDRHSLAMSSRIRAG